MGFGGKLESSAEFEVDGMKFKVARLTTDVKRKLVECDRKYSDPIERMKERRKIIATDIITGWSNVTEVSFSSYFVSNQTHYGSKSFDVTGDNIDINRADLGDVLAYSESLSNVEYQSKAKIAIDELLVTKDAKIEYSGKIKKMNADIREEIKNDDAWESVVDFIWDKAVSFDEFVKPDLSPDEIVFNSDRLIESYWNPVKIDIIEAAYKFVIDRDNFRAQEIIKEAEEAKN